MSCSSHGSLKQSTIWLTLQTVSVAAPFGITSSSPYHHHQALSPSSIRHTCSARSQGRLMTRRFLFCFRRIQQLYLSIRCYRSPLLVIIFCCCWPLSSVFFCLSQLFIFRTHIDNEAPPHTRRQLSHTHNHPTESLFYYHTQGEMLWGRQGRGWGEEILSLQRYYTHSDCWFFLRCSFLSHGHVFVSNILRENLVARGVGINDMKRIKLKRKEEIKFSSRVKQISAHKISLSHTVS